MESTQHDSDTSERTVRAAGEWLVNLCSEIGSIYNKDQVLTPLEQLKFDEFFALHGHSPIFKRYHVQAVRKCLSRVHRPKYELVRSLLERDVTGRLFVHENDVHENDALQVAIKWARLDLGLLGQSPEKSNPELMDMVKLLMDHGAPLDCSDKHGYSPLYYTCVLGYADLFQFLVDSGANISTIQKRTTPEQVIKARQGGAQPSLQGEEVCVNLLQVTLDAFISPQYIVDMTWVGWPPGVNYDMPLLGLDIASTWGCIIFYLLEEGMPFAKDDLGLVMLLHIACFQGSLNHVEKLLKYGVMADIPGPRMVDGGQGEGSSCGTAMHAAAAGQHLPIIKTLISQGQSPVSRRLCIFGRRSISSDATPIEIAIAAGQYEDDEELETFLKSFITEAKGLEDSDYKAVLAWCVRHNKLSFAEELLQCGIVLDQVPSDVVSVEMAKLLISYGTELDPVALQQAGLTKGRLYLLRWCVEKYGPLLPSDPASWGKMASWLVAGVLTHIKVIEYLIKEYPGPHIDTVLISPSHNSEGEEIMKDTSWLYLAIMKDNVRAIRLFLEAGADPRCPGLSTDAATTMRQVDSRWFELIPERLEVIIMVEERLSDDGRYNIPSYSEIRSHIAHIADAERQAWDKKVEKLAQNRQEVPHAAAREMESTASHLNLGVNKRVDFHRPLANSSSFRLLELLPSSNRADPLLGRLVNSDITFQPTYEALSYVWGDVSPVRHINLDGNDITITPNLHSALIHLRSMDSVRTIWVDALCINQSFHDERNQQVRIMGDIYKSAKQVIIWLGEAADDSHLVFEHIKDDTIKDSFPNYPAPPKAKRNAWTALIKRPWFYRTWVIQEIALARRAVIMCGEDTTLWQNIEGGWKPDFSGGANGLSTLYSVPGDQPDHPISGFDPDSHIWRLRLLRTGSDPMSILHYSRACQTTEIRDRIYGILGLFDPGFIEVDYDLPVEEIFRRFTKAVILSTGNLLILKHAGRVRKYEGLPSWVPDFTETSTRVMEDSWYAPWREDAESHYEVRSADGKQLSVPREDLASKYPPEGLSFSADGTLVLKGKMVDTIDVVGIELPVGVSHAPGTDAFALVMKEWETLAKTLISGWKSSESSVSHAFATTLSAPHGYQIFNNDIGFTQWYRHCGTGILEKADPSLFLRDYEFYLWWYDKSKADNGDDNEGIGHHFLQFSELMMAASYGRCLFTTEKGSMGLANPTARTGDQIIYFPGSCDPFLLRKRDNGEGWILVGSCYLYGLDIDELFRNKDHLAEDFRIY